MNSEYRYYWYCYIIKIFIVIYCIMKFIYWVMKLFVGDDNE